jgi:hypothetical protein
MVFHRQQSADATRAALPIDTAAEVNAPGISAHDGVI